MRHQRLIALLVPLALFTLGAVAGQPPQEVGPPPGHSEQGNAVAYQDGLLAVVAGDTAIVLNFECDFCPPVYLHGVADAQTAVDMMAAAASGPVACAQAAEQACHGHVHHAEWHAASDGHPASCVFTCYEHAIATPAPGGG